MFHHSSIHLLFQLYLDAIAVYRRSFGTSPRTKDTARGAAKKKRKKKRNIAEAKKSLFEKTICYAKKSVQIIEQIQENVIFHAFL